MKPELTAQILGMYIGRPCDAELRTDYTLTVTVVITPVLIWYYDSGSVKVTPHLRRLESITEDEAENMYSIAGWSSGKWSKFDFLSNEPVINDYLSHEILIGNPAAWLYLLSRGFDLFGLIDAGLAKEVEQ